MLFVILRLLYWNKLREVEVVWDPLLRPKGPCDPTSITQITQLITHPTLPYPLYPTIPHSIPLTLSYNTAHNNTHTTLPFPFPLQGRVIAESNDIMQVLEEEYPTYNPLLPKKSDPQSPRVAPLLRLEVRNSDLDSTALSTLFHHPYFIFCTLVYSLLRSVFSSPFFLSRSY